MNPIKQDFIISICKHLPAMEYPNSVTDWFSAIQNRYNTDVRLEPELASQLVFMWLAQNKLVVIQNVESAVNV